MGERLFKVCDAKIGGKMCNERNVVSCTVCELDFCPMHHRRPEITISMIGGGGSSSEIAKIAIGVACFRCIKALGKTSALFDHIKTEDVIRHARAHLSAEALE